MAEYKLSYTANEIDEKLGKIATPDWNASEGESGYVKNRTHYNNTLIDIEFDGDFSNAIDGMYLKVSDSYYTVSDLLGATTTFTVGEQNIDIDLTEEHLSEEWDEELGVNITYIGPLPPYEMPHLYSFDKEIEGLPAGTYLAKNESLYISKIYKGELKQLDKMFIPNYNNLATKDCINRPYEYIGEYSYEGREKEYIIKLTENYSKVYVFARVKQGEFKNMNMHVNGNMIETIKSEGNTEVRINLSAEGLLFVDVSTRKEHGLHTSLNTYTRSVIGENLSVGANEKYIRYFAFNTGSFDGPLPAAYIKLWGVKAV